MSARIEGTEQDIVDEITKAIVYRLSYKSESWLSSQRVESIRRLVTYRMGLKPASAATLVSWGIEEEPNLLATEWTIAQAWESFEEDDEIYQWKIEWLATRTLSDSNIRWVRDSSFCDLVRVMEEMGLDEWGLWKEEDELRNACLTSMGVLG